jgi:aminotransferase
MIQISRAARNTAESPIRKMFNLAASLDDVVSFTVGEPDFPTPANIVDKAVEALRDGQTHYTPNAGILPLRAAIATSLRASHGLQADPETEVMVANGGMQVLLLLMTALLDPGDEVIVTDPYWPNYVGQIRLCGGVPVFVKVREENGFVYDPDDVRKAVGPRTRAILVNSPANPTGGVAGRECLAALAALAVEKDLTVISDEVYRHFLYEGAEFTSIATFPGMRERTILVDSCSKTFAMTGWRVGWAVGPREVIRTMVKLQENASACVNSASQYAAIEALQGSREPLRAMLAEYAERRALLLDGIARLDRISCVKPRGAFYAFVNIRDTGLSSEDFATRLVTAERVAVVPGTGFGPEGEGFVRLSYATSRARIREGLDRIGRFLATLR